MSIRPVRKGDKGCDIITDARDIPTYHIPWDILSSIYRPPLISDKPSRRTSPPLPRVRYHTYYYTGDEPDGSKTYVLCPTVLVIQDISLVLARYLRISTHPSRTDPTDYNPVDR